MAALRQPWVHTSMLPSATIPKPGWDADLAERVSLILSLFDSISALIPSHGQLHVLLCWCEAGNGSGKLVILVFSWKSSL